LKELNNLEEMFDFSKNPEWIVRIVICEMNSLESGILNMLNRIVIPYGQEIVYVAIQVGPYLLYWLNNSELRIRRVTDTDSALLIVNPRIGTSFILPSDNKTRQYVTNNIFNFRQKTYNTETFNCLHFVYDFLSKLNIDRFWKRNNPRPIRSFIEYIHGVDRNNYSLSFYNITSTIKCHSDLNEFWIAIQDPLKFDLMIDPYMGYEVVDLIDSLEKRIHGKK